MKKNRKKAETYRFNGHPSFHPRSIQSVTIAELEARIEEWKAKLADYYDPDDRKWTRRWLQRYERELDKKRKGLALKEDERRKSRQVRRRA
jgi:hypothetical protein